MKREAKEILDDLILALEKILPIMKMDHASEWPRHFEGFLEEARDLSQNGSAESAVRNLCSEIRSMYGGKGPFTEYSPMTYDPKTGRYSDIPGTEQYPLLSQKVCELSNEIRIDGS